MNIGTLRRGDNSPQGRQLRDNTQQPEEMKMNIVQIAKMAHEINKAYCEAIGDYSQPEWNDAPDWQRDSAINGVEFHLANPDASPSASHDNWLKQKLDEGWTYGEVKDPEKKEHPCCVPYEKLPVEQRAKDYLFRQVVHSLRFI